MFEIYALIQRFREVCCSNYDDAFIWLKPAGVKKLKLVKETQTLFAVNKNLKKKAIKNILTCTNKSNHPYSFKFHFS